MSSPTATTVDPGIRIPIGQPAQVTVGLNDPITTAGDPLDGWTPYRFRAVHVIASEPMKAIVRVVSDTEADSRAAAWQVLNPSCCLWRWQSIHQVTVTVPAPADLVVELGIPVNGLAETFTVSSWRVDT